MPNMSFGEAAQWFQDSAREFEQDVLRAERVTVDDLLETAQQFSSGTLKPKDLRRMDHPYAKRHGAPKLNPAVINAQTGEFRGAWQTDPVSSGADGLESALYNTDPKAEKWLEPGTKKMFARPIDELIESRVAPRREARIEVALNELTR